MAAMSLHSELAPAPVSRAIARRPRETWIGSCRRRLRAKLFQFLRKIAETDDAKSIQVERLRNLLPRRPSIFNGSPPSPYPDLGQSMATPKAAERADIVFITARFRSGSTALWNLFRHMPGVTSYYEPLNERRWFDPQSRGSHTDRSHRGVDDYWREYEGLTELARYYRQSWIDQDLFMDADSWDPGLKRYVELLVERAPGRPVLQFNRIDFRLPWFRRQFPNATVLHLYRHPRDQWCSSLWTDPARVPRDLTVADFGPHDHFYLLNWARDLKYYFPFLAAQPTDHPYRIFYLIWKLSYLFGREYAHQSLAFEDLVADPNRHVADLLARLGIDAPVQPLAALIEQPPLRRWTRYAPDEWFQEIEAECEAVLGEWMRPAS